MLSKAGLEAVMRVSTAEAERIRAIVRDLAGDNARVYLFGSRLDDDARGGDLDLLVEVPDAVERPAWLSAHLGARISRAMQGRATDVILKAQNLAPQPIHDIALTQGVEL